MYYEEWKNRIKPEKKERKYQHVDDSLDIDNAKIFQRVVHTLENIKDHQFLPFIKREETQIRFRQKNGVVTRSLKKRPIMYASHIDAHIYSYHNFILSREYESYLKRLKLDENVIAYRKVEIEDTGKGKSNVHFAKEVFDCVKEQDGCVVITHDIEKFFDNLDHSLLKNAICKITAVEKLDDSFYKILKSLTKSRYIEHSDFRDKQVKKKLKGNKDPIYQTLKGYFSENKTNKGIPQGSPISGLLANIYLVDFDMAIKSNFPDVFYRRYSDDLIFICKPEQKEKLSAFIIETIKKSKLDINPSKSFISYFKKEGENIVCDKVTDGLGSQLKRNYVDYLGLEYSGRSVLLRKNTIQKLKKKQNKKVQKQVSNIIQQKRRRPRKINTRTARNRNSYLKRAATIISTQGIEKQILNVAKKRNKARLAAVGSMTTQKP